MWLRGMKQIWSPQKCIHYRKIIDIVFFFAFITVALIIKCISVDSINVMILQNTRIDTLMTYLCSFGIDAGTSTIERH